MTNENHPPAYEDVPASHIYMSKETTKSGMLNKKSGGRKIPLVQKKYEPRFVIIHKGWVYYYLNSSSEKPQGKFSLQGFSNRVIPAEEEQTHAQYVFKLYHKRANERTWFFAAENQCEMQDWTEAFRSEIERYTFIGTDLRTSRSMPANPLPSQTQSIPRTESGPRSRSVSNHPLSPMSPMGPSARSSITDVTSGFVSDAEPDDLYEEVDDLGHDGGLGREPLQSPGYKPYQPTPFGGMALRSPKQPLSPFNKKPLPPVPEPQEDFPLHPPPRPPQKPHLEKRQHPAARPGTFPASLQQQSEQYYEKYYDNPGDVPYDDNQADFPYDDNQDSFYDVPEQDASYEPPCSDRLEEVQDITYDDHEIDHQSDIVSQLGKPPIPPPGVKPKVSCTKTSPPTPPTSSKPNFNKPNSGKPNFSKPDFSKPNFSKPAFSKPDCGKPYSNKPDFSKPNFSKPDFSNPHNGTRPGESQRDNSPKDSGANTCTPNWRSNLKSPTSPGSGGPPPREPGVRKPETTMNSKPLIPNPKMKPNLTSKPAESTQNETSDRPQHTFGAGMLRKTNPEKSNFTSSGWQKKPEDKLEHTLANKPAGQTRPPWARNEKTNASAEASGPSSLSGQVGSSIPTKVNNQFGQKPPPLVKPKPTAGPKPLTPSQKPFFPNKPKPANSPLNPSHAKKPGPPPPAANKPKPANSFQNARNMFQ